MGSHLSKETSPVSKFEEQQKSTETKLLLLGAGGSGKTTIYKQLQLLQKEDPIGMNEKKSVIYRSIQTSFVIFLKPLNNRYGIRLEDREMKLEAESLLRQGNSIIEPFISSRRKKMMKVIWCSEEGKDIWSDRNLYSIPESLSYFLHEIERICSKDYVPNKEDYLKSYVTTIGVRTITVINENIELSLKDIGGQRKERIYWRKACIIKNVSGILHFINLAEFDEVLYEDSSTMRDHDSKDLLAALMTSKEFEHLPFWLVFTKKDVLERKVQRYKNEGKNILLEYFPSYAAQKFEDVSYEKIEGIVKELCLKRLTKAQKSRIKGIITINTLDEQDATRVFDLVVDI